MVERRPVSKAARIGNGAMINLGITVNAKSARIREYRGNPPIGRGTVETRYRDAYNSLWWIMAMI